MPEKILVTGGSGFIGSNLVRHLVRRGKDVRVLDNNSRGSLAKLSDVMENIEFIEGDIRDAEIVDRATAGIDTVYHLAYINGTKHFYEVPELVLEVGVKGAINTIDAALKHRVNKYIFASSSEVYQTPTHVPTNETERLIVDDILNPRFSYGGGKILGELLTVNMFRSTDTINIIFRPHNFYGQDMGYEHVIPEIVRKIKVATDNWQKSYAEIEIQGNGEETRAFCHIEDAIHGIVLAADQGEKAQVYHIGRSEECSIKNLLEAIAGILKIELTIKAGELRQGSTLRRCPDISKISQLGYSPRISLNEGLRRTVEWYRNNV